jgi:hypothetical protein
MAAERLGRQWLEEREVVVSNGRVSLSSARPLHGPDVVARSGYYDPAGARVATVAHPSFRALTGMDADYAVTSNPMNIAQLGFGLFPPDIWLGPAPFRVIAAERFNTVIVTWAWSKDAVAFLSIAQDTGHRVVLTVLGVATGTTIRYGLPDGCGDDMVAFSPDDREVWLGTDSGRPCALDLTTGEVRTTSLPSGPGFAWSPDGHALAVTHGTSITVIRSDAIDAPSISACRGGCPCGSTPSTSPSTAPRASLCPPPTRSTRLMWFACCGCPTATWRRR